MSRLFLRRSHAQQRFRPSCFPFCGRYSSARPHADRRGGRVAECAGLLNRCRVLILPGVRIPPSPHSDFDACRNQHGYLLVAAFFLTWQTSSGAWLVHRRLIMVKRRRRRGASRFRIGRVSVFEQHGSSWIYYCEGDRKVRRRVGDNRAQRRRHSSGQVLQDETMDRQARRGTPPEWLTFGLSHLSRSASRLQPCIAAQRSSQLHVLAFVRGARRLLRTFEFSWPIQPRCRIDLAEPEASFSS